MKSFLLKIALLLAVVGVISCSMSDVDNVELQQPITEDVAQQGEVRIVIPEGTRSVLEDNGNGGANLRWTSGDEIKLVARNENGTDAFEPCVFYFWANTNVAGESYFRTPSLFGDDRETTMPEGSYTYYAVSPSTATIDGTTAKFTLPATQNGEFSTDVDFMVAKATGTALVACQGLDENRNPINETDPKNDLPLVFKHKTHILRFTIPAGNNRLGQKVKKLHMVFPTAAAGTMAINMDDGTIVSIENTTNKITVDFAEPKDAGEEFYVMILPQTEKFANEVDMRFEGVDGSTFSTRHLVDFGDRVCSENKLTPVQMSIPAPTTGITSFYYTEGPNNLGEDLWSMNITLPDGYYFTDFEQTRKAEKDDDGKYTFSIFNDMLSVVENQTLPFAFESENALITQTVSIGDLTENSTNNLGAKDIPYLFEEDFSGISSFSDGEDNVSVGFGSSTWVEITDLSTKSSSLDGWYAARIGCSNGAVRICCRYQNVAGGKAYYKGRLYTPFMSNIKPGRNVKINISFKYGSANKEPSGFLFAHPNANPLLYFGIDTQEEVVNYDDTGLTSVVTGGGYSDQAPSSLIQMSINGEKLANSGGSYTSFTGTRITTLQNVDNKSRLAWIVSSTNDKSNTNGNYWLYLDDIKVSITK